MKQQLELYMEQLVGSRLRKEYSGAVFCHPVCLIYTLSKSWEMDELQAKTKTGGRNINNHRYVDNTTLIAEREEELKSLLMRVKEESERASLKLNIKKTKIMASGPMTSWQIERGKWK